MKVLLSILFFANCVAAAYENVILLQREKTTGHTRVRWLGDFANQTVTLDSGKVLKMADKDENLAELVLLGVLVFACLIFAVKESKMLQKCTK